MRDRLGEMALPRARSRSSRRPRPRSLGFAAAQARRQRAAGRRARAFVALAVASLGGHARAPWARAPPSARQQMPLLCPLAETARAPPQAVPLGRRARRGHRHRRAAAARCAAIVAVDATEDERGACPSQRDALRAARRRLAVLDPERARAGAAGGASPSAIATTAGVGLAGADDDAPPAEVERLVRACASTRPRASAAVEASACATRRAPRRRGGAGRGREARWRGRGRLRRRWPRRAPAAHAAVAAMPLLTPGRARAARACLCCRRAYGGLPRARLPAAALARDDAAPGHAATSPRARAACCHHACARCSCARNCCRKRAVARSRRSRTSSSRRSPTSPGSPRARR